MSGEKLVKRYRFLSIWQIAENEAWFAEMSKQGLHLHSLGSHFAAFRPGEPAEYIYSIEPLDKEFNNEERLTLYADAGWEFVTQVEQFQVFRAPAQANVKQIHTDRSLYLELLQERKKTLLKSLLANLILGTLYIAFLLLYYSVLTVFLGLLILLPYLFLSPNISRPLLDYYYLQHYIKRQHLLQQNSPSYLRAVRIRQFTVGTARLVGLLIFVAIVYTGFRQTITKPLSLAPAHILTLGEVYEDFNKLTEQELITENEFATTSSLRFSAWTRYSHSARDKNGDYFTLSGNVYIANNVTAAQQMIKAILTSPVEITGKVSEYTHLPQNPGFDELFLSGNLLDNGGQLIVRHGTYVYEIFFIGDGKLVLEALYRKVNQLL